MTKTMTTTENQLLTLGIVTRAPRIPSDMAALDTVDAFATHGYRAATVDHYRAKTIRNLIADALASATAR